MSTAQVTLETLWEKTILIRYTGPLRVVSGAHSYCGSSPEVVFRLTTMARTEDGLCSSDTSIKLTAESARQLIAHLQEAIDRLPELEASCAQIKATQQKAA